MKRIIRLTESDLTRIVKQVIQEQSEHVKNLYKSWANKRSGNPEKALSIMDDVFKYQKQLSKKDFAQYSSYEELVGDLNRIKQAAKSEDATKIYEDKDLLVLKANTHEASCKYGAGSKWCTTAKDDSSYWRRHNDTGTEFFWIFKNKPQDDPNHKFSYHVKITGEPDWCNAVNNCMSTSRLSEESYPKKHPKYAEIIEKLQEIHDARELKDPKKLTDHIQDWFRENYDEIEPIIIDNDTINDIVNKCTSFFLDGDVYDYLPFDIDLDDEDATEEFISNLEKEIRDNFVPDVDGSIFEIIDGFSWLINQNFEDPIDYLNTHTPEEVINELGEMDPRGLEELINEVLYGGITDQLVDFTMHYGDNYQP
jgi:hypothetical protein